MASLRELLATGACVALTWGQPASAQAPGCPPSGKPVAELSVAAGSAHIDVLTQGSGPAILMIPSIGRGAADFDATANCLAGLGYRVLRPQPRGVGGSTGPLNGATLRDYAADAIAVLAQAGAPAVVVGHAFGGFVARMVATERPDLVRGVVLAAADAGYRGTYPGGRYAGSAPLPVRTAIQQSGDLSLPDEVRLGSLRTAFFASGYDPRAWLGGWYPAAQTAEAAALDATPVDAYFWTGNARVLDLEAQADAVAPAAGGVVMQRMLGARVTVRIVPDAGHALFPEQPVRVAREIDAFVRSLPMP